MPQTAMISSLPSAISAPVSLLTTVRVPHPHVLAFSASSHSGGPGSLQPQIHLSQPRLPREAGPLCLCVSPFFLPCDSSYPPKPITVAGDVHSSQSLLCWV